MSNHGFELNRHPGSIHPANGSGAAVNDEVDAMDVRSGRPSHIADGDGAARLQIAEPSRTRQEKNRITYLLILRSESRLAAASASWRWRRGGGPRTRPNGWSVMPRAPHATTCG